MNINPYASPAQTQTNANPIVRRRLAFIILMASIGCSLAFTFVDEAVLKTHIGTWPLVYATAILAFITSIFTRDWLIAPLCCFVAIVASGLLMYALRPGSSLQLGVMIWIAIVFSTPSLIVATLLFSYEKRIKSASQPNKH